MHVPSESGIPFLRLLQLAGRQHFVVSVEQASRIGVDKQCLYRAARSGKLERCFPGVYRVTSGSWTWRGQLMAAHLWLGSGSAISHASACALWELPGFSQGPLELSTPRKRTSLPPVVVHCVRADLSAHTTTVGCIPTTNAGRSLVDVAGSVDPDVLEAAMEAAIRRRLTSHRHLLWLMEDRNGKGAKGIAVLRRLVGEGTDSTTESELEIRLLQTLRQAGLPDPVLQHEIRDGDRFVARVDFAYPWAKVAIEADSYSFHSGRQAWESDLERRGEITALGWLVIHVTHRQMLGDLDAVINRIRAALSPSLPIE